jgi:hypothetical protein
VVAEQHRPWWEEELAAFPAANVVIQPENKGTAIGLLLGVTHVLQRDPSARFIVFPSDHFVADEDTLHGALVDAVKAMRLDDRRIVLLGMLVDELDPEYGWIVCGRPSATGVREVLSFREKPDRDTAALLQKRGALVNSFMLAGTGVALVRLSDAPAVGGDRPALRVDRPGNARQAHDVPPAEPAPERRNPGRSRGATRGRVARSRVLESGVERSRARQSQGARRSASRQLPLLPLPSLPTSSVRRGNRFRVGHELR